MVYHVLNRGNARARIFDGDSDFEAFEQLLMAGLQRTRMRLLAYCLMPNHWHMVLWPRGDGDLPAFVGWVTMTHTQRVHAARGTAGSGHLYQGRYKSFPVQSDAHFLTVCRYVERNAKRARLVRRAENWRWCSLWHRAAGARSELRLDDWPVDRPRNWTQRVNKPETPEELQELRQTLKRNRPYGDRRWVTRISKRLGLESTLRPRGRPTKKTKKGS